MDETGMISAFGGDTQTILDQIAQEYGYADASAPTPTSQTDFNVAGSNSNPLGVLGGIASVITSAGNAIIGIQSAQQSAQINSAANAAATAKSLQNIATQGQLAKLQNATVLAQAQAAYNKAAGVVGGSSNLTVILAVVGVALAAVQLSKKH